MFKTTFDPASKVWSGVDLPSLYDKDATIGRVVLESLYRDYNKIVQINDTEDTRLTGGEIHTATIRCAIHLQARGINFGDVIGLVASNTTHLSSVVFGAMVIGAPVSALDPSFIAADIAHMFRYTQPKLIFCDHNVVEEIRKALVLMKTNVPLVTFRERVTGCEFVGDYLMETATEIDFVPKNFKNGHEITAFITCSSGTTGLPKGVKLSHAIILSRITSLHGLSSSDISLCLSTLYWLTGLATLFYSTIIGAVRLLTTERFTPDLILGLLQKYNATNLTVPPSVLGLLLNSPKVSAANFSKLRLMITGGSAVPVPFQKGMEKLLNNRLAIVYGMSEICGVATINVDQKIGSVGCLLPSTWIKIVDDDNVGLGIGATGEICIKTQYSFLGYYGDEEAIKVTVDNDGYIHSGDIGYFDNDGHLYVTDRKKDILKYKGFQISPTEIEDIILKIVGVKMACVVGIPDAMCTDLPAAVVVRSAKSSIAVTADEICKLVEAEMVDFKRLRGGVYFVDALPMTASGKIQRNKVRAMIMAEISNKLKQN